MRYKKMSRSRLILKNLFLSFFPFIPNIATSLMIGYNNILIGFLLLHSIIILIISSGLWRTAFEYQNMDKTRKIAGFDFPVTQFTYVKLSFYCFFLTICSFAAFYQFLYSTESNIQHFNISNPNDRLEVLNSLYFSIITAATVGYGDISPKSIVARFFVSIQVIISFVFIVAIIARIVNNSKEDPEK